MRLFRSAVVLAGMLSAGLSSAVPGVATAEERLPWQSEPAAQDGRYGDTTAGRYENQYARDSYRANDSYGNGDSYRPDDSYGSRQDSGESYRREEPYPSDRGTREPYGRDSNSGDAYRGAPSQGGGDRYGDRGDYPNDQGPGYGEPYAPPPHREGGYQNYENTYPSEPPPPTGRFSRGAYEQGEIITAGHGFFGSISQGLANAIEYAFKSQGRPNGYILGQDAGGAFVLGLRYGEGKLYTKDAGTHPVFWQGPSLGYDAGAEGSKTMVLVYNLRDPSEIYHRFGGVQGAAYLVGGVSLQFQKYGDVMLGVIRSGVGLRLGANVGYLKYTRTPTWNPL